MTGRIFAVVGPSGVGKDTLMQAVRDQEASVEVVRRVVTRPVEAGGEDFVGAGEAEFAERVANGAFALHWTAHGLSYGIPGTVRDKLSEGKTVLFNGSRAMLTEAAKVFPNLRVIHVTASDEVLAQRLRARGREGEEDIANRLKRANQPLPEGLDVVEIKNSTTLEVAVAAFLEALEANPTPA